MEEAFRREVTEPPSGSLSEPLREARVSQPKEEPMYDKYLCFGQSPSRLGMVGTVMNSSIMK